MEEAAYVLGRLLKGAAGLAYALGDTLLGMWPNDTPQRTGRERRRDDD